MTKHLKGFGTIFPMTNETVSRSIEILDQMSNNHATPSDCLLGLMNELGVKPREGMVLYTNWQAERNKPKN